MITLSRPPGAGPQARRRGGNVTSGGSRRRRNHAISPAGPTSIEALVMIQRVFEREGRQARIDVAGKLDVFQQRATWAAVRRRATSSTASARLRWPWEISISSDAREPAASDLDDVGVLGQSRIRWSCRMDSPCSCENFLRRSLVGAEHRLQRDRVQAGDFPTGRRIPSPPSSL